MAHGWTGGSVAEIEARLGVISDILASCDGITERDRERLRHWQAELFETIKKIKATEFVLN